MVFDPEGASVDPDDLFQRARDGDNLAWEELFQKCYPKIIRAVRRKLNVPMRSMFDSTDFASDVMKSLAANADRLEFDSLESLIAFLKRVAEQKVIDEYRKAHSQKRDIKRQVALNADERGSGPVVASNSPTASQIALATETHEQLLSGQDEPHRQAIVLKAEGFSLAEISEQTGWNLRKLQRFFKELKDAYIPVSRAPRLQTAAHAHPLVHNAD